MANPFDPTAIELYPETGDFPIAVRAADPDGHQAFYFVKKEDGQQSKYRTQLSISNTSGGAITISKSDAEPHFTLRFRPGLVNTHIIQSILPLGHELQSQLGPDWVQNEIETDGNTGVISVGYRYTGDTALSWSQHTDFSLQLRPATFAPLTGAFFVKLELDYHNVIAGAPLVLNLAVVDLSGQTHFPATAMVRGSNTILNDGASYNDDRTLLLWPDQVHSSIPLLPNTVDHESGTTITVAIRCADTEDMDKFPDVLGTQSQVAGINLTIQGRYANPTDDGSSTTKWQEPVRNADTPGWITWAFTPPDQTWYLNYDTPSDPSDSILSELQFTLNNIISSAPNGIANVYIHFHHVPGYADHTLIVPFQKGPIVVRGQNVGIGVTESNSLFSVGPLVPIGELKEGAKLFDESQTYAMGKGDRWQVFTAISNGYLASFDVWVLRGPYEGELSIYEGISQGNGQPLINKKLLLKQPYNIPGSAWTKFELKKPIYIKAPTAENPDIKYEISFPSINGYFMTPTAEAWANVHSLHFKTYYYDEAVPAFTVNEAMVGIGTANLKAPLQIELQAKGEIYLGANDLSLTGGNSWGNLHIDSGKDVSFPFDEAEQHPFGTGNLYLNHFSKNDIYLIPDPTGTGKVGIGTNEPSKKLDVSGDTKITGALEVDGNAGITGELSVGAGADAGDNTVLLTLNSQRPWQFQQVGTDATSSLQLKSNYDGKPFSINNPEGYVKIKGKRSDGGDKLIVEGTVNILDGDLTVGDDATVEGDLKVGGRIKDKTGDVMPVGTVVAYGGTTAPEGWLLCNGREIPEGDQYQDLREVLGTTKVPLLSGKFILGVDDDYKLNKTGGAAQVTLTEDEMPRHTHKIYREVDRSDDKGPRFEWQGGNNKRFAAEIHHAGGDKPHNNMPPYYVLNYIIKY